MPVPTSAYSRLAITPIYVEKVRVCVCVCVCPYVYVTHMRVCTYMQTSTMHTHSDLAGDLAEVFEFPFALPDKSHLRLPSGGRGVASYLKIGHRTEDRPFLFCCAWQGANLQTPCDRLVLLFAAPVRQALSRPVAPSREPHSQQPQREA